MKSMLKKGILLMTLAVFCLCASGCSLRLSASPDDLYTLPKLPDEYTELDNCIQSLISDGAEYAAPISGTNVQPVQLVDLDGDGQEEAIAFLRKTSDEKPLKIYIFEPNGDSFQQRTVIEGSGTSIYSVMYEDLDGDGMMEMLVGWKVGAELQALTVFSLRGPEPMELMSTNYVKYAVTSLDSDKHKELAVLRADDEGNSVADYYTWHSGSALELTSTARLSMTMAELNSGRVIRGKLQDGSPALFVTGISDSSVEITDILTTRNGELFNAALSDTTGVSTEIYRFLSLYPTDINGDGVIEVPSPVSLPTRSDGDIDPCCRIDWRSYDAAGTATTVESTYHDTDDGWYLVLPDSWNGKILITRAQSGMDEMTVTFSIRGDDTTEPRDFLRISTITGNSREIKAVRGNRFILSRQAETIYAAELLDDNASWEYGITEDQLCAAFSLITTEWMSSDN
jgi:hypothetical protein